ncbi:MAG: hypothetical protein PS018_11815 [bacterium]|nr:hypothetical protein [bacterium]
MANKEQRQKIRFVDDLVKPERISLVEPWPGKEIAHLCHDAAREIASSRQLQPGTHRRRVQKDKGIPGNS